MSFQENYLENIRKLFRYYKSLGDQSLERLNDEEIHFRYDEQSNNAAAIAKHMAGNMLSRWTDFLHSDGEKEWRNREDEFVDNFKSKADLIEYWEKGWNSVFSAIDPLQVEDLDKIAYIRNEGHSVLEAINRQLGHYSYHIGQLVMISKSIKGQNWQSLSIPKGQSNAFNQEKFQKDKSRKNFI